MKIKSGMLLAVMLLSVACGSVGLGDLGSILGSSGKDKSSDVTGTVNRVDTSDQRIDLDVSMVNNLREERRGSTIYYDSQTVVEYDGRSYKPEDLERGDEISIRGVNSSGRYIAERITVTRNVRR